VRVYSISRPPLASEAGGFAARPPTSNVEMLTVHI